MTYIKHHLTNTEEEEESSDMIKDTSPVTYHLKPVRTYPTILTGKLLPVLHQASLHEGVRESISVVHVH